MGGGGGWGGLHSHFRGQPNRCVVLCWGWGFDNIKTKLTFYFTGEGGGLEDQRMLANAD